MERLTHPKETLDHNAPKSRVRDLTSGLSSMKLEGDTDKQLDGINYSDRRIQATIKQQDRDIAYMLNTQRQTWKNLEIEDLNKYYNIKSNSINNRMHCLKSDIQEKSIQEAGNSGSEKVLRRLYEKNSKPYQRELEALELASKNLEKEFREAKAKIFNNKPDFVKQGVEKWHSEVEEIYNQEMQNLDKEIDKEKSDLSRYDNEIGAHNSLIYNFHRNADQEAYFQRLKNTIVKTRELRQISQAHLNQLENKKSELEKKLQWREHLLQEQKAKLHNLAKDINKNQRVVKKDIFTKMQGIAKQSLEDLDPQELQSSVEQYLTALDLAQKAVQNKLVADRKGKGLAEGEWE